MPAETDKPEGLQTQPVRFGYRKTEGSISSGRLRLVQARRQPAIGGHLGVVGTEPDEPDIQCRNSEQQKVNLPARQRTRLRSWPPMMRCRFIRATDALQSRLIELPSDEHRLECSFS